MSTKISTSVNIAGVELKNPVMTASGTFGSGAEYSEFVDLSKLGAVVTKGVAGQSDSACGRSLWRHVKCYRTAESGH